MGCFSNSAPAQPNYGQVTRDTLQAQVDLAPQQYASEAAYQPLYANLSLGDLNTFLNGTPGGQQSYTTTTPAGQTGWYDASGKFLSPGELQQPLGFKDGSQPGYRPGHGLTLPQRSAAPVYVPGAAPSPGATWYAAGSPMNVTGTRTIPGQAGLTSLLQQANTAQRTADINDVANLGPQATQAMLQADPYNAQLLASLNSQANAELSAGSGLTPDQARAMAQQSRAAFAARGMSGSAGATADEILRQFNLGQQLLQQRQQFAQSVLGNNQAVIGDPFQQILGRPSSALPAAYQGMGQSGPSLFNPQAGLGLAGSNYAAAAQAAAAKPTGVQQIGSLLGGIGSII